MYKECKIAWCRAIVWFLVFAAAPVVLKAQAPKPPIPIEMLAGSENLYYQVVVKRPFDARRQFNFFGLATYTATYNNEIADNRMITITQLSYHIGKGLGVMAGTDMNSFSGFSPIIGPQHNFANRQILAVTVASFFLNEGSDFKLFGLYEYKPQINEKWSTYTRLQFIYNHGMKEGKHNKSYIYLRAGVKRKSLILGIGANVDWSGPNKSFQENYGGFVRWEFR